MREASENPPLVSVLMTAYNRQEYIGRAIGSVLESTYAHFELIVVDDCSNDGTFETAAQYATLDARIRIYRNETTLGDYPNRNRAASYATGKYLKYLDSDDAIYPHGLEVMVRSMEQFPDAGYGLSQVSEADRPHPVCLTPYDAYRQNFFGRNLFGRAPGSSIIRRDVFLQAGGFSGKRQVGDHEFWLKLSQQYSLVTMPRDLVWDRVHPGQQLRMDSDLEKVHMHWKIDLAALSHPACPLSPKERWLARAVADRRNAKIFWQYAFRNRSLSKALEFRQRVGLTWTSAVVQPFVRIPRLGAEIV